MTPSTVADASRKIKAEELDACKAAGVTEVQEIRIGYDGIVFASDIKGPDFAFEPADWFNAIGAKVLKDGQLVDNPNAKWSDVKAGFPDWEIAAYIPGGKARHARSLRAQRSPRRLQGHQGL